MLAGEMDSITARLVSIGEVVADERSGAYLGLPPKAIHRFTDSLIEATQQRMKDVPEGNYDYQIGFLEAYNAEMASLTDIYFNQLTKVARHVAEENLDAEAGEA